MSVADRISQLASERGITVFKLAGMCGIDYRSLRSNMKKGYEPSLATVRRICLGLGLSLSDFFLGVDNQP